MAIIQGSGDQSMTLDTEHSLATVTSPGSYQLAVDASALANGDRIECRIYGKVRNSDDERLVYRFSAAHEQVTPMKVSIPVATPHYFRATVTQVAGTSRTIPWAVYSL